MWGFPLLSPAAAEGELRRAATAGAPWPEQPGSAVPAMVVVVPGTRFKVDLCGIRVIARDRSPFVIASEAKQSQLRSPRGFAPRDDMPTMRLLRRRCSSQ